MALRHWLVLLVIVPAVVGGCFVASSRRSVRELLGLDPSGQIMTVPGLAAGAATAAVVALVYALAVRGGVARAAFAASACFALTILAAFGWMFGAMLVWAYALCDPGAHDMCLRH